MKSLIWRTNLAVEWGCRAKAPVTEWIDLKWYEWGEWWNWYLKPKHSLTTILNEWIKANEFSKIHIRIEWFVIEIGKIQFFIVSNKHTIDKNRYQYSLRTSYTLDNMKTSILFNYEWIEITIWPLFESEHSLSPTFILHSTFTTWWWRYWYYMCYVHCAQFTRDTFWILDWFL